MNAPDVDLLLDVDREYRDKANAGRLRRIAPRRQNPAAEAWLPVLHTRRDGWNFTALFSNTQRAHLLHRAHEVRGREPECARYYRRAGSSPQPVQMELPA